MMIKPPFRTVFVALLSCVAVHAAAQHHPSHAHGQGHAHGHGGVATHSHSGHSGHNAYAGLQTRTVKALSAQQIEGLRQGRGMGMAMAAELNGYPGPMHVLELADALKLSEEQTARTRSLYTEMLTRAKAAGAEVIAAEQALDALFANRSVSPNTLTEAVSRAAVAQGRLRETHLRYHLSMMDVLSPSQVAEYNRLRGY